MPLPNASGRSREPDEDVGPPRFAWECAPVPTWQWVANAAVATSLLVVFALQVRSNFFIGDDAFISFRYARNLVDGFGPVWNAGEAVEGYTNFLWVVMMAAGMAVGVEPERASTAIGVASGLAVIVLVLARNARMHGLRQPLIFLAPLALVASRSFTAWSSGGLETQFFTLAVLVGIGSLCWERRRGRVPWIASLVFAVATLVRPEGALFMVVAGACLAVEALRRQRGFAAIAGFVLPFLAIVGVHLLWRHAYYGYWLPNTFYAKVHGLWFEQGAKYFGHFLADYRLQWFLPFALVPVLLRRRFDDFIALASLLAYVAYVAAIGGDRFEFRFLVVVLPLAYVQIADGLILLWRAAPRAAASGRRLVSAGVVGVAALLIAATTTGSGRPEALRTRDAIASIGAIRSYAEQRVGEGRYLRDLVDRGVLPADLRVAVTGAGALPYYTMWPAVDIYGLNDAKIAHQEVRERTQIAHEQQLPPGYLAVRQVAVVDSLNRLVFGADPTRMAPRLKRARRIAKTIRLKDQSTGLDTPARMKCLRLTADRVMIFVTVLPEAVFSGALGHLDSCDPHDRGEG